MALSEEERKARRAAINRRYYEKKKKLAKEGDPASKEKWDKDKRSRRVASVRSFLKHEATIENLEEFKQLIDEELRKAKES